MFRETADFFFGEDQNAILLHVEDPTTAFDHPDFRVGEFFQDRSGQTGRSGLEVSLHAIFDGEIQRHIKTSLA